MKMHRQMWKRCGVAVFIILLVGCTLLACGVAELNTRRQIALPLPGSLDSRQWDWAALPKEISRVAAFLPPGVRFLWNIPLWAGLQVPREQDEQAWQPRYPER